MKLNKILPGEYDELMKMYFSGKYTLTEIADWFGVSYYMIKKAIKNYGE